MGNGLEGEFAAYSLVWSDEFDGPAGSPPDRRFWEPETGGHGWGNQELQYYTDSTANAALDGAGHLGGVRRDPEFTVSDDTLVVAQTFRLAGD